MCYHSSQSKGKTAILQGLPCQLLGEAFGGTCFGTHKGEFSLVSRSSQSFLLHSWRWAQITSRSWPQITGREPPTLPFFSLPPCPSPTLVAQWNIFQWSLLNSLTNCASYCLTESLLDQNRMWFLLPRIKHKLAFGITSIMTHKKQCKCERSRTILGICLPFLVCRGGAR